ncbi:hypothetical protein GALMADRAFT_1118415 [Galerina marginata CBS 339.88]|uniref:Uncharacterized protein n=1 Tax=Galerina marginata (strain CBS 339.88) TaxID=685588 RepID=A0A067TCS4_GALM3|nr:hypothetical protein GALMADRAFT_1118415 [Galerina marginata CBS 339.88]
MNLSLLFDSTGETSSFSGVQLPLTNAPIRFAKFCIRFGASLPSAISSYLLPRKPQIPQEIIDLIIDELGRDQEDLRCRSALRDCALVCRSFRPRTAMYIFETVQITQHRWKRDSHLKLYQRFEVLLEILEGNPSLGPLIHGFDIDAWTETRVEAQVHFWWRENAAIPLIFKYTNSIQRFRICEHNLHFPVSWEALPKDMAASFEAIIASPSLRKFHILNFEDFPVYLLNSTGIVDVTFSCTKCRVNVSDVRPNVFGLIPQPRISPSFICRGKLKRQRL